MMMFGSKKKIPGGEVFVALQDEGRVAIGITGGRDDIYFECSLDVLWAIGEALPVLLEDKEEKEECNGAVCD